MKEIESAMSKCNACMILLNSFQMCALQGSTWWEDNIPRRFNEKQWYVVSFLTSFVRPGIPNMLDLLNVFNIYPIANRNNIC